MVVLFNLIELPLWMILTPSTLYLLFIYGTRPYSYWKKLGYPDGPRTHPFIGSMKHLFDPIVGVRRRIEEWKNLYGRVVPMFWFRDPALLVMDVESLRQIFVKDFNNWTDRYLPGHGDLQQRIIRIGLFFSGGSQWRRIRKIMSPTFTSGKLKSLAHYMNLTSCRLAEKLAKSAKEGYPASAKDLFGAYTADLICGMAFGLDINSMNDPTHPFFTHVKSLMTFERGTTVVTILANMFPILGKIFAMFDIGFFKRRDVKFFEKNIKRLVQDRKNERAIHADFLQLLLNAEAAEGDDIEGASRLTTEEIAAQGIILILAGYDTTSTLIQFLTYELAKHHDIQERVVAEINDVLGEDGDPNVEKCMLLKYMEAVINETLRMYPPVHLISRQAKHDTILNGRPVPAGAAVSIPIGNIARDPEFFPDPDVFNPERFLGESRSSIDPVTFLAFGFGPRQCIGMRLALFEVKVALVHILRSVKIVKATPEVLELEDITGMLFPKEPIQLHLQAAQSNKE